MGETNLTRATEVYGKMNNAFDLNVSLTVYFSRSWTRLGAYLSDIQENFEITRWANFLFDTEINYLGAIRMNISQIETSTRKPKEPISLVAFSAFLTSVIVTINDTSSSMRRYN